MDCGKSQGELVEKSIQIILEKDDRDKEEDAVETLKVVAIYIAE